MVEGLGRLLVDLEAHIAMPREFVVPGETRVSATLEQARTVIRRAERRAVTLRRTGLLSEDSLVIPYLNRLADLAWILARAAEQAEQRAPRPARTARPARSARLQPTGATVDAAAAADGAAAPGTPSRGRVPANLISRPHDRRSSLVTMPPYASPTRLGVRPTTQLSTTFLTQAFLWMFIGLLVTTGVGVLIAGLPSAQFQAIYALWFPIVIGQLIIAFALSLAITRIPATIALLLFFVYAASMGVTFAVVLVAYDFGSIAAAGISSASVFAGAAAYGAITRRNLDSIGGYLVMGLVGLIVAMVVNWFLGWSTLNVIISIVGVLLFTGLTAWHVQRIQRGEIAAYTGSMEKSAVMGAFLLYLDFINLFFLLLRLFGGRR
jgi:FtsH-binding integral membrane protein